MLDRFADEVGPTRFAAAKEKGVPFHEIVTLAALVERETADDTERAPIAGVFRNRMAGHNETAGFLGSDPTVFYLNDTLQLAKLPLTTWPQYVFWAPPKGSPADRPAEGARRLQHVHVQGAAARSDLHADRRLDRRRPRSRHARRLPLLLRCQGRHDRLRPTYAEHLKNIKKLGGA